MSENKVYTVIGMMSGTSLDGVDCALIRTDGEKFVERLDFATYAYDDNVKTAVRAAFGARERTPQVVRAEELITNEHIAALRQFGHKADLVGFHGQSITHDIPNKFTWQIGDAQRLANECGMDVVADLRLADVAAGGQGAPLIPAYHAALAADLPKPVVIFNIGGVGNVTYLREDGSLLAFDTGPGNALINDYMKKYDGKEYDIDGSYARSGNINAGLLEKWLSHPYFDAEPPKSLDRSPWDVSGVEKLSLADAARTLTEFTVESFFKALDFMERKPHGIYVTGGGRHNLFMMESLRRLKNVPVHTVEDLGWNGDAMEAEGWAYLAVRSLKGLPITYPETTGAPQPMTGGTLYKAL